MEDREPIRLDLQHDAQPIAAFVEGACKEFAAKQPGRIVTGVEFMYFVQGGFLELCFYDAPNFEPNYDHRLMIDRKRFYLQHWGMLHEVCFDLPTETTTREGKKIKTEPGRSTSYLDVPTCKNWRAVARAMGELLVDVATSGHEKIFASLQKANPYSIAVYDDEPRHMWEIIVSGRDVKVKDECD